MFGTSLLPFLFMIDKWKKNYSTRVKIEYNQEKKYILTSTVLNVFWDHYKI